MTIRIRKYMVITYIDGEQDAQFFVKLSDAEEYYQHAVCGVGASAEVYERDDEMGYQMIHD